MPAFDLKQKVTSMLIFQMIAVAFIFGLGIFIGGFENEPVEQKSKVEFIDSKNNNKDVFLHKHIRESANLYANDLTKIDSADVKYKFADLNDDGISEIMIITHSVASCGASSCSLVILEQNGDSYNMIFSSAGEVFPEIQDSKTNSYYNLKFVSHFQEETGIWRWNGEKYNIE